MYGLSYILEKLYLGGLDEACDTQTLKHHGISHILTVDHRPLSLHKHKGFTYKHVCALDMDSTDLLGHFQDCLQFIEDGRQDGGILVHCFVGQSRSATLVLAYVMQKLDMSLDDAETLVMKQRPKIRPNSGFREQLELFETMGNQVDRNNQEYKVYRLKHLASILQKDNFTQSLPDGTMVADPSCGSNAGQIVYKCRKCRRALFQQSGVLNHTEGRGELAFGWKKRLQADDDSDEEEKNCDQSLFIEPVQWMENIVLQLDGKLTCPKCQAKLGSFKWSGEQCQCGTWVTPAFHIQPGKVDKCPPRTAPQSSPMAAQTTARAGSGLGQTSASASQSQLESSPKKEGIGSPQLDSSDRPLDEDFSKQLAEETEGLDLKR